MEQGEHSRVLQDQRWEAVALGNNWHCDVFMHSALWPHKAMLLTVDDQPSQMPPPHPPCPNSAWSDNT